LRGQLNGKLLMMHRYILSDAHAGSRNSPARLSPVLGHAEDRCDGRSLGRSLKVVKIVLSSYVVHITHKSFVSWYPTHKMDSTVAYNVMKANYPNVYSSCDENRK
jgi:hypothetical protein